MPKKTPKHEFTQAKESLRAALGRIADQWEKLKSSRGRDAPSIDKLSRGSGMSNNSVLSLINRDKHAELIRVITTGRKARTNRAEWARLALQLVLALDETVQTWVKPDEWQLSREQFQRVKERAAQKFEEKTGQRPGELLFTKRIRVVLFDLPPYSRPCADPDSIPIWDGSFLGQFASQSLGSVAPSARIEFTRKVVLAAASPDSRPSDRLDVRVGAFKLIGRERGKLEHVVIPGWKPRMACLTLESRALRNRLVWSDVVRGDRAVRILTVRDSVAARFVRGVLRLGRQLYDDEHAVADYVVANVAERLKELFQSESQSETPVFLTDEGFARELSRYVAREFSQKLVDLLDGVPSAPRLPISIQLAIEEDAFLDELREVVCGKESEASELFTTAASVVAPVYARLIVAVLHEHEERISEWLCSPKCAPLATEQPLFNIWRTFLDQLVDSPDPDEVIEPDFPSFLRLAEFDFSAPVGFVHTLADELVCRLKDVHDIAQGLLTNVTDGNAMRRKTAIVRSIGVFLPKSWLTDSERLPAWRDTRLGTNSIPPKYSIPSFTEDWIYGPSGIVRFQSPL